MFIRTESDERIKHSDIKKVWVEPHNDSKWMLCASIINGDEEEHTEQVAIFDTVRDANGAEKSLNDAMQKAEGWDAKEYKESPEPQKIQLWD